MGICPVEYGKVIANFPEGLIRPLRIPAIGLPPATPGCHISTIALLTGSNRFNSKGRPLERSNIIGLPVFCNSIASFSWICGNASVEREAFSPLQIFFSPRQRRITSDCLATATASANPDSSSPSKSHPLAYNNRDLSLNSASKPSYTLTTSPSRPWPDQEPSKFHLFLPIGPITAILADAESGSTLSSFFNNTTDSSASFPAISKLDGSRNRSSSVLFLV